MARSILTAGALVWLAGALAGFVFAALGTEALERSLPPLVIDTDALRGALVAVAAGLAAVGLAHLAVVIGLRAGRSVAATAGILLAATLAITLVALAVASGTSAVADPGRAASYLAGAGGLALAAIAYGAAAWRLVGDRRAGSGR